MYHFLRSFKTDRLTLLTRQDNDRTSVRKKNHERPGRSSRYKLLSQIFTLEKTTAPLFRESRCNYKEKRNKHCGTSFKCLQCKTVTNVWTRWFARSSYQRSKCIKQKDAGYKLLNIILQVSLANVHVLRVYLLCMIVQNWELAKVWSCYRRLVTLHPSLWPMLLNRLFGFQMVIRKTFQCSFWFISFYSTL